MLCALEINARLQLLGDREKARLLQRFFKTGPGHYAEGDVFIGLTVPVIRKLAKEYTGLPLEEISSLLQSPLHEARLLALILLIQRYEKKDPKLQARIYALYLHNTRSINNWDLVDVSAARIVGSHLKTRSRKPLYRLAESSLLWERRIAIVATFHFIRSGEFTDTLQLAEILLGDREDLIHKATGWMLREVGKRDRAVLEDFLKAHCARMPRTMLRYAIEKFPDKLRLQYLKAELPGLRN